jgi:hypothetical protein
MNKKAWVKSSYSGGSGGNCLEVNDSQAGRILVRDTKDLTGPVLRFTPDTWVRFAEQVKGERSLASDLWPIL